jgi:phosphoglycolate phosphatase-like HAD superfamily hydrolase
MIGDAHRDIKAGHRAGVKTIHLTENLKSHFLKLRQIPCWKQAR